ncbi:MAG: hypothetical protein JNL11_05690 [Bdellovibrionaceae bacterium]|nr:hypothetical protein [Pseudobdellovibrionaceae bacterium]
MHSKFNRMMRTSSLTFATVGLVVGCSSAPKVSKNPAEEQSLQAKAAEVTSKGQTESAKAGGYDPVAFWQDRNKVSKKWLNREVETGILSKSQKVFVVDFKVRFHRHDTSWLNSGTGLSDFLSDAGQDHTGGYMKTVSIKEKKAIHTITGENPEVFQKITDTLYKNFVAQLETAGYKVSDRSAITYKDMIEHLNSDKMVPSPQKGEGVVEIYAPTGWKLEKSTMDTATLSAAFGDTVMKLAEQNSRKVEESIGVSMAYDVDLGEIKDGKYWSNISTRGSMAFTTTYYSGVIDMSKPLRDGIQYKYNAEKTASDSNTFGRATATVAAMALGKSMDYSTSETFTMVPEWNQFENRVVEHGSYLNDLIMERVRQGRDD